MRGRLDRRVEEVDGSDGAEVMWVLELCGRLWMHARHCHGEESVAERTGFKQDGCTETGQLVHRMRGLCVSSQRVQ